jgi:hypothetical protein
MRYTFEVNSRTRIDEINLAIETLYEIMRLSRYKTQSEIKKETTVKGAKLERGSDDL